MIGVKHARRSGLGFFLCLASGVASAAPVLSIDNAGWQLVSSVRVGRTEYDYTYRPNVTNRGSDALNVRATLSSTSSRTVVIDGAVTFGAVNAGATVAGGDTFTVRQDRTYAFDPAQLK